MNTFTAIEMFDKNFLQHDGVPGMSWHKHKFGKWQNHAVYAQGMYNPGKPYGVADGVVNKVSDFFSRFGRGGGGSSIGSRTSGNRTLDDLTRSVSNKSIDELRNQKARLDAETAYIQAIINRNNMNRNYQAMLDAPKREREKKIKSIADFIIKSTPVKAGWMMAGNAAKYSVFKSLRERYGQECASAVTGFNPNKGKDKDKQNNGDGGGQRNNQNQYNYTFQEAPRSGDTSANRTPSSFDTMDADNYSYALTPTTRSSNSNSSGLDIQDYEPYDYSSAISFVNPNGGGRRRRRR